MSVTDKITAFDDWLVKSYWTVAAYADLLEEVLTDWRLWQQMFETAYLNGDYKELTEFYQHDREKVEALARQFERRGKTRNHRRRGLSA